MRKPVRYYGILLFLIPVFTLAQTPGSSISFGEASYSSHQPGKFLKSWMIAGPVPVSKDTSQTPDVATQEKFFNDGQLVQTNFDPGSPVQVKSDVTRKLNWKKYSSSTDQVLFDTLFKNTNYAAAYALAEIHSDRDMPVILGVGSDDAIKVMLNGKVIHSNWIARGITADDDIIPVDLVKGRNQILIEVQDIEGGWGFIARFLDGSALSEKLIKAAGTGDLAQLKVLIARGADVNLKGKSGINALQAAKINGRTGSEKILIENGAKEVDIPSAEKLVEGLYAYLEKQPNPGIAILVSREGKVLYKKGFGYADIKNKKHIVPETKFRIGSITKQFTASAILRLQEEGRLQVTDKLSKYFPDFPRGNEVTIHQLLTHTSGIHSYTSTDSFLARVSKPVTNDELLNYFKALPYDFNPGEKYLYNNSGYFLLGYIIEKLSGESLDAYLRKNFFIPLGMNNTGIYKNGQSLENEATGYTKTDKGYDTALNWNMSWAAGAGALYSTVEDLYKWNESLFNGKVLSKKSLKAAFTPVVLQNGNKPPGGDYGYGWGINRYRGYEVFGHSGGLHGFLSQLARYPEEKMTVVLLTNQTPAEVVLDPNKIAEQFIWQKLDSQSSYEVKDIKDIALTDYDGRYDFQNGTVLTVSHEGNSLFAQLSGQGKFPIYPAQPDEFFWKVVEAKIKFNRNEKGEVVSAYMEQGTFKITAPRLEKIEIITVDPSTYKEYTGKYDLGQNIIIDVTTTDGKIYAQATGNQRYEILPVSTDEFFLRELNARFKFLKGGDEKVNKVNIDYQGTKKDAMKMK